jgi:protein phosphatase
MNKIGRDLFIELLTELRERFASEPSVIIDSSKKICFVGDIHGDIETVEYVRKISKKFERIVWLGDFVDRGAKDIEVVTSIAKLDKKNVILAGNHDAYSDVWPRDFGIKLQEYFGENWEELEKKYVEAFKEAPIAYFNERYNLLAVHGFIPINESDWNFRMWKKSKGDPVTFQILWNDPSEVAMGWRGDRTYIISTEVTEKFFSSTGIKTIVRSHQPRVNKIFNLKNGKIVNLGSSSVYGTRAIFVLPKSKFIYF